MAITAPAVPKYELVREGEDVIIRINYENYTEIPSIEDSAMCMAMTVDILVEVGNATKIVFSQKRDYEYDYEQTVILIEIAKIYKMLIREKLNYSNLAGLTSKGFMDSRFADLQDIVYNLMKRDPIAAYIKLKRIIRREKIIAEKIHDRVFMKNVQKYVEFLEELIEMLRKTKLIVIARPYLGEFRTGDREIYRHVFTPTIKPDFMYTKLMASYPVEGEELDSYQVGDTEITIFGLPDTIQYLYHMVPPEFKLSEDKYVLLDAARKIMAEHKPSKAEFVEPERMRSVFANVGMDMIEELGKHHGIKVAGKELQELTEILVRYTVGFGLIEVLLADERVQDITINSPMGQIPMFIVHQDWSDCKTNIFPTVGESESWASKLRMLSGRPLDEANPILDTEITIPGARARIAVISPPLNPSGLGYAFRRHRDKPWTLPLFIKQRMVNELAAGILSFIVDGTRTMLVAGTRSAGKTSLLSSLIVEIMRKYRIITIEDTLELPTESLRKMGFNVQPMKVASAMTRGTTEVSASEGIRTTLRLGDSSLIVGEVRSEEARSLYEAMRVGALANVVAGTIHADSPYGVYDRVVNDLKVPKTSFKATDIIVVANPIRSADGLHRWRRVTAISEVRKFWDEDPIREGGFVDLMRYDPKVDELVPSPELINGDSDILKSIAGNVKEWAGNWDAVWDNVTLRGKMKKAIVEIAEKTKMPEILEASYVIQFNDEFHRASDRVKEEVGYLDSDRIFFQWNEWMKKFIKKLQMTPK